MSDRTERSESDGLVSVERRTGVDRSISSPAMPALAVVGDAILLGRVGAMLRQCGVQHPEGQAALAQLAWCARSHGFDFELDEFSEGVDLTERMAVVNVGCDEFLLELPLIASDDFFGEPNLKHTSESTPLWVHASTAELNAALLGMLKQGKVEACATNLALLRDSQQILKAIPESSPSRTAEAWQSARKAFISSCGECEPSCQGLRAPLYSSPSHYASTGDSLAHYCVLTASLPAIAASQAYLGHWTLTLDPAVAITRTEAKIVLTAAGHTSEVIDDILNDPSQATQIEGRGGRDGDQVQDIILKRRVDVPTGRLIHRQRWALHMEESIMLSLQQIPVSDVALLPKVLQQLRQNACFSTLYASAASETFPINCVAKRQKRGQRHDCAESRVELQMQPPASMTLLFTVPAPLPCASNVMPGHDFCDGLVELHAQLADGSNGEPLCWRVHFEAVDEALLSRLNEAHATKVLNASQSLPLTVAFVYQRMRDTVGGTKGLIEEATLPRSQN